MFEGSLVLFGRDHRNERVVFLHKAQRGRRSIFISRGKRLLVLGFPIIPAPLRRAPLQANEVVGHRSSISVFLCGKVSIGTTV